MMDAPRILIVDDEPGVRFVLKKTLAAEGYDLELASDGGEAIRKLDGADFDVLLVDLKMMPVDGLQVINALRAKRSDAAVIILTAHSTIESAVEALRLGAFDYLFKPAAPEVIRPRPRSGPIQPAGDAPHAAARAGGNPAPEFDGLGCGCRTGGAGHRTGPFPAFRQTGGG
jgi:DNA-binding response OmpR family regulator